MFNDLTIVGDQNILIISDDGKDSQTIDLSDPKSNINSEKSFVYYFEDLNLNVLRTLESILKGVTVVIRDLEKLTKRD